MREIADSSRKERAIYTIFNERKLVLELLRVVKVKVTVTMKKFEIAWMLDDFWYCYKHLDTEQYSRILFNIKYRPVLPNIVQYCQIVQMAISTRYCLSCHIDINIQILFNVI